MKLVEEKAGFGHPPWQRLVALLAVATGLQQGFGGDRANHEGASNAKEHVRQEEGQERWEAQVMATLGFAAALRNFEVRTTEKINDVLQGATADVLRQANTPQPGVRFTGGSYQTGKVPVDLGNLYESLTLTVDGGFVATGPTAYEAVGAFRIGSMLFAGWTAKNEQGQEYGIFVEMGTRHIQPRWFVTLAVQDWQNAVAAHASRAAGR